MSGMLGIGLRSLMAYQSAIQVTSQNLENALTPFYSRRQVNFVESMFSTGVEIGDVRRVYDEVANSTLLKATSNHQRLIAYCDNISELEKLMDSDANSINKYMNDSLQSLQELTTNVQSVQSRTSYLAQLTNISNRIRTIGDEIAKRKENVNQSIAQITDQANSLISQISSMNTQINHTSLDQRPSLLDKRNALVHELAKYINFDTRVNDQDYLTLSLANGLTLVSQAGMNELSVVPDPSDSTKVRIMAGQGSNLADETGFISGGELYGLLQFRNNVLDTTERGIGRLALALADTFNRQNHLGTDLYGQLGNNIFEDINTAAMQENRVANKSTNGGSGVSITVNIDDVSQLTASDYRLVFSSTSDYTLTRISDNAVMSTGTLGTLPDTITADGFTATIASGTFVAGDMFTVKPTYNAMQNCTILMSDPKQLALGFAVTAQESKSNLGQGKISVVSVIDTANSAFSNASSLELDPPLRIEFITDTTYRIMDVSNPSSPTVVEGPISYNPSTITAIFPTPGGYDPGYRINLMGSIKAGDQFSIDYNAGGIGNGNALAFANLYTKKIVENSGLTLNQSYQYVSSDVSLKTNAGNTELSSAEAMFKQAEKRYDALSGVSRMEEVANLAEFQQAYQASAQVIQAARTIFDTIISLAR